MHYLVESIHKCQLGRLVVQPVASQKHSDGVSVVDVDPTETQEWLDSIRYVLESKGVDRKLFTTRH